MDLKRLIANNSDNMDSIVSIAKEKYTVLGRNLSLAILAEYPRYNDLKSDQFDKIGVVPIFRKLVQAKICSNINIALLSEKLKIIPANLIPFVRERMQGHECRFDYVGVGGFFAVKTGENSENTLVDIISEAMVTKRVNIVVGEIALLGEGWNPA